MSESKAPYFPRAVIENALALHAQSYEFLLWMAELERRNTRDASHQSSRLQDASFNWIEKNYEAIPPAARPKRADLRAFANLFATYLESSFNLDESPGERLYSEDAHCFCPMCSWMVAIPNLQPKKLTPFDKRRAKNLQREFVHELARTLGPEAESACDHVLADTNLKEDIALATWMGQLLRRLEGVTPGPAILALWRAFAWKPTGSPKKNFQLSPQRIEQSLERVQDALTATGLSPSPPSSQLLHHE